jgi:Na+-translocating ferredoxin:NAD+ oxidoreductase RnfD subunit
MESTLKSSQFWPWRDRLPSMSDPRWGVLAILASYIILGITVLGFNRSPAQILLIISSACCLDITYHWLFRKREILFPLSGAITGCSLSILTNFGHGLWLPFVPVFFAISSKYLITFQGRHVFNPALFGITLSLLLTNGAISAAPAYQWGGSVATIAFIITAALIAFVFKIKRTALIISFLIFYTLQLCIRAFLMQWHLPPETLFMGALSSPAFYLFTFFMITDPKTSPQSMRGQIGMAFFIVVVDLILHKFETLSTFFFAGFAYFAVRFIGLHVKSFILNLKASLKTRNFTLFSIVKVFTILYRWGAIAAIASLGLLFYQNIITAKSPVNPEFKFIEISAESAGISSQPNNLLDRVDSRVKNVAKWMLSVGDAVAVSDFDNDGLQDIFLTYPLKSDRDRAALYRNRGNFQFERVPLPILNEFVTHPTRDGLPAGALWFDWDNDRDSDLLITVGYGKTKLLQNRIIEDGKIGFSDISEGVGIEEYTISLTANAFDMNRDGHLDLLVGNAMNPYLSDYEKPTKFNIFKLPEAEYPGDRRMFNFMHRSWYDANNGGENLFYLNRGNRFEKQDIVKLGFSSHRWTLDIGTGDLDGDGWTDIYLANDFGPDQMFLNQTGKKFRPVVGRLVGQMGRDTYKGMNASLGDLDNNGYPDIYVSNVHEKLQAEGSLLWMNAGTVKSDGDRAFSDEAMRRNALNENRFGWGGAIGDLNRDGRLDLLQANGMVDDNYDRPTENRELTKPGALFPAPTFEKGDRHCPDYWYWNAQIALTNPDVHGYADRWADLQGRCIFPYENNRVYLNEGDKFIDISPDIGWDEPGNSRGIALSDLDNDGDLDALVTHQFAPISIYRNDSISKPWIGLKLEGNGISCNRDAVGTKVILQTQNSHQLREVRESNGFSAQGDRRLLFGFPTPPEKIDAEIYWCGDSGAERLSLSANRYHHLIQK